MKNTYYFPHDYHARHDPKIERLFSIMGYEGIGIYWCLIERMYEQGGYLDLKDIIVYANGVQTLCDSITKVVRDYKLFEFDKDKFWSESCLKRLHKISKKSEIASKSAHKRWSKDANAMQTQCDGNAYLMHLDKKKEDKKKDVSHATPSSPQTTSTTDVLKKIETAARARGVDWDDEMRKMDIWLAKNPKRKKTDRFIAKWMMRADVVVAVTKKKERGDV